MDTQNKIRSIVLDYKRLFPQEFQDFLKGNRQKISLQKNKFGTAKEFEYQERLLVEYPETLYASFKLKFTDDDWAYLDSKSGIRWFAKEFPEFRAVEKI